MQPDRGPVMSNGSLAAGVFVLCLSGEQTRLLVAAASSCGRGGRELPEERSKENEFLSKLC